jgi:hypothetical protein
MWAYADPHMVLSTRLDHVPWVRILDTQSGQSGRR